VLGLGVEVAGAPGCAPLDGSSYSHRSRDNTIQS
jgi:hypothetical protein